MYDCLTYRTQLIYNNGAVSCFDVKINVGAFIVYKVAIHQNQIHFKFFSAPKLVDVIEFVIIIIYVVHENSIGLFRFHMSVIQFVARMVFSSFSMRERFHRILPPFE